MIITSSSSSSHGAPSLRATGSTLHYSMRGGTASAHRRRIRAAVPADGRLVSLASSSAPTTYVLRRVRTTVARTGPQSEIRCQNRQHLRVQMRVQACLYMLLLASVRCSHESRDLQPVSLSRSTS